MKVNNSPADGPFPLRWCRCQAAAGGHIQMAGELIFIKGKSCWQIQKVCSYLFDEKDIYRLQIRT